MKKKLIIIFLAIVVGGVLAFFTLIRTPVLKKENNLIDLIVLQTGVYENKENALREKNNLENAIIYYDGIYYRVIVGASTNEAGLEKIENILDAKNIKYYKKNMQILEEEKDIFNKYNMLLEKASNEETIILLNQKILEKMSSA